MMIVGQLVNLNKRDGHRTTGGGRATRLDNFEFPIGKSTQAKPAKSNLSPEQVQALRNHLNTLNYDLLQLSPRTSNSHSQNHGFEESTARKSPFRRTTTIDARSTSTSTAASPFRRTTTIDARSTAASPFRRTTTRDPTTKQQRHTKAPSGKQSVKRQPRNNIIMSTIPEAALDTLNERYPQREPAPKFTAMDSIPEGIEPKSSNPIIDRLKQTASTAYTKTREFFTRLPTQVATTIRRVYRKPVVRRG